jgi:hypothetical protein
MDAMQVTTRSELVRSRVVGDLIARQVSNFEAQRSCGVGLNCDSSLGSQVA